MEKKIFIPFFIKRFWGKFKTLTSILVDFIGNLKDCLYLTIQKDRLWFLLKRVEPIESLKSSEAEVEIVSLVSHRDLPLYLTAIKTLFYFSRRKFLVTVFEDGTFTPDDIKILKSFIRGVRFVSVPEAENKLKKILRGKKYCQKFRREVLMTKKIIDLVFLSLKKRILMLDSDLIFFQRPKEITQWIEKNNGSSIFMSDYRDAYIVSKAEAKYCFGLGLVSKLNSGLIGFNTKIVTLNFVERFLKEIFRLDLCGKRAWLVVEQTALGLLLSKKNKKRKLMRLPRTYLVSITKKDIPSLICRHYIGSIRELFYPKAINVLKQIVSEEGK